MPLFSQNCLENIRQHVSIVDLVAPYVQLKPSGHYLKGLSPFSNEKTPSFFVDPQKNIFKCFSTGHAGDIFRFLELKEQLTFSESVEWLCERFNIQPEYADRSHAPSTVAVSNKRLLLSIYANATQFFKQQFWNDQSLSIQTRHYWQEERHFSLETAKTFDVGFAPTDRLQLYTFLTKQGFTHEQLCQSGLFYNSKGSYGALTCRYQGRLMVPICDIQGHPIAFSGRQLPFISLPNDPTQEAKYVNSPETPVFIKGRQLFNLARARQEITQTSSFFLVEGPLDVIRCWECGLKTAVAPQGTGLTDDQLKLLKRYDRPIVGLFDGDSAGIKAGVRLMTLGLPLELPIKYYLLQSDEDPDSAFLKDPQRVQQIETDALSPVVFFIEIFKRMGYANDAIQRNVLQHVLPIIKQCESSVQRFELLHALAKELGIPQNVLNEDLVRLESKTQRNQNKQEVHAIKAPSVSDMDTLESQIFLYLLHYPQWTAQILKNISLDWIETSHIPGQLLLRILNEFQENGIEPLTDRSFWQLSADEEKFWCQCLVRSIEKDVNLKANLTLILQHMYRRYLKKLIFEIDKKLTKSSNINAELFKKLQMDRFSYKKALADVASSIYLDEQ